MKPLAVLEYLICSSVVDLTIRPRLSQDVYYLSFVDKGFLREEVRNPVSSQEL